MNQRKSSWGIDGIWIPMVTPMRHGAVDLDAAQDLAGMLVDSGITGLVVCGTTGEASCLDDQEQLAVLRVVRAAVEGRCPVLMGLAGSSTRAITAKAAQFTDLGADGFLVSPPSYVRPSQEGIVQHFQSIAGVTALPLMLYDIPARTGVGMELETIVRLAADPQFIALKQCGGGLAFTAELLQAGQLKILCGDDAALFCSLCLGAHGAISAAAHIRPDLYVRLFHLVQGGQLEQAGRLFAALLPMIRLLFSEPNPGPVKAALAQLGLLHDELRLPMMSMSTAGQTRLAAVLEQVMALPHESAYAGDKASQSSLNFLPPRAIWELA